MATKSWKQLSEVLSEVLSQTLKKGEVSSVMEAWNERKDDVSKLVGSSTRATKKKKDPNAPKRWRTSYILFCGDHREKVKKENPDLNNLEITSKLGELWKGVSDKEKKKYEDLAAKDKARYNKDMESYTPPSDAEVEEKPKKSKKDREGPKHTTTSYMFFCKDVREQVEKETGKKGKEAMAELGRRWKELSDEEKAPYIEQQNVDKARYEKEKAEYADGKAPAEAPTKGKGKGKKASAKADDDEAPAKGKGKKAKEEPPAKGKGKGKKAKEEPAVEEEPPAKGKGKKASAKAEPPKSKKAEPAKKGKTPGFECFSEEQQDEIAQDNPDWSAKKVAAEVNRRWQELTDDDREAYETEAAGGSGDEEVELEEEDD